MFLYLINVIFLFLACVLIIIGALIQSAVNGDYALFSGYASTPAALFLTFGALLFLTSLLSLLGVYCRSPRLLSVYSCIIIVLIVVEISVGISGCVVQSSVFTLIADFMRSAESRYNNSRLVNTTWNSVQHNLKCCGMDDYTEWFQYLDKFSLPDSCCVVYAVGCGHLAIPSDNFHQRACAGAIAEFTYKHEIQVTTLFTFIIICQLLSVLCTKEYRRVITPCKSVDDS